MLNGCLPHAKLSFLLSQTQERSSGPGLLFGVDCLTEFFTADFCTKVLPSTFVGLVFSMGIVEIGKLSVPRADFRSNPRIGIQCGDELFSLVVFAKFPTRVKWTA